MSVIVSAERAEQKANKQKEETPRKAAGAKKTPKK